MVLKHRKQELTENFFLFIGPPGVQLKWKKLRKKYDDERDNAGYIIECSNVCPFRWRRGMFACGYCPEGFVDFLDLREHTIEHSNRLEALRFSRPGDLIKVDVSDLRCELCLQHIKDVETLLIHLYAVHNKPIRKGDGVGLIPFILRSNEFICPHCDEKFSLFNKLNSHINEHYPNNVCPHCGKAFSAMSRLKSHLESHGKKDVKCPKCSKVFTTKTLRDSHLAAVHDKTFRYKCPICNEVFLKYRERIRHLKEVHDKNVEYACHLCPAVFAMCNQRTKHIRQVHIKEKNFLCEICDYQSVTAGELKNHMVRHEDRRTFKCTFCKKAFARAKTLKEHLRIHYNDKRFSCEFCSYSCIQKVSLRGHYKSQHGQLLEVK